MHYAAIVLVALACLVSITRINTQEDYGLYHYNFDHDPLIDQCTKEKPLIFHLMVDFLTMVKSESNPRTRTQQCVIRGEGPGFTTPPGVARNVFAITRIVYNTYARYSRQAQPTTMYDGWTRMPETQGNVRDCVYIYGFYHIARYLMPERVANFTFKEKYEENYSCDLTQISAGTDSEFGLVQRDVEQLISELDVDGFNQKGCFADTSNFRPINPPCRFDNKSTIEICRNFTHTHDTIWNYGEIVKTGYIDRPRTTALTQAQQCKPFSLGNFYDYLAPPYSDAPAFENGTKMDLRAQFREIADIQQFIGDENDKPKLIAEHWADGPNTTATPGHWQSITLNIIRRLCYDNDDAIKLLFAVSAATYDAGLAAWQNKRLYNSVRPATFIPIEYMDEPFTYRFVGMYCDFENIEGWEWTPYQEDSVITPEFQEYISGHSTFSRAASFVLEKFTGSPNVPGNLSVTVKAGTSLFQPRCNQSDTSCQFATCRVNASLNSENNFIPKVDVTLGPWKTYRDIANEASISRIYGGIHVRSGDIQGRIIGQKVGEIVWDKLSALFNGTQLTSSSGRANIFYILYPIMLVYGFFAHNFPSNT